ncbi:hypothetical protein [Thermoanaerobacterium sp. RBIITD]|uniref:hypothetical protein n=1 Tax=Thermoanaerobacterium sp. RBIITD TaxID=1550240 RepID=UPI000BBFE0EF|nr:hypothetical protein [Thermoanaerobacterium sp. RBIITD]SNX54120.1 hypothetical protein SAMN05660242_1753 [Thermoanaerobacterium sp. RBIITD]
MLVKVIYVFDFLFDILTAFIEMFFKRLTPVFVLTFGEIKQGMSLKHLYKTYRRYDYFKNKDVVRKNIINDYIGSFKDIAEKNKGKTYKFATNMFIYKNVLLKLEQEHILTCKRLDDTLMIIPQPSEKLVLMSSKTVLKNLFNPDFYKQVFKREYVYVYELTF